ncbi:MAG: site-2 protease family protein [Verrucomicrobiota bacterium]
MWRFRLLGFPVSVHWTHGLVLVFASGIWASTNPLQFRLGLVGVPIVFFSILWHEFGHAWAFRRFGGNPRVRLHGFGGDASAEGYFSRRENMIITLAGPAAGLVVGLSALPALIFIDLPNDYVRKIFSTLVYVNVIWSIVNLLPIYPLDGGQFLKHLLHGEERVFRGKVGMVVSIFMAAAGLLFVGIFGPFMVFLFAYLAYLNWAMATFRFAPDFRDAIPR